MTDPVFQAPTPPKAPELRAQEFSNATPVDNPIPAVDNNTSAQTEQTPVESTEQQNLSMGKITVQIEQIKQKIQTYFWYSVAGIFLLGLFMGCAMKGGEKPVQQVQGLTNIVANPDIVVRLPVCGRAKLPKDACVLYILNNKSYDVGAKDFFADAARLTARQPERIEFNNLTYANMLIKPGFFAQIQIPSMD